MKELDIHHPKKNGASAPPAKVVLFEGGFRFNTEVHDSLLVDYVSGLAPELRDGTCDSALEIGLRVLMNQRDQATVVHLNDQLQAAVKAVIDGMGAAGEGQAKQLKLLETTYLADGGKLAKALADLAKEFARQLDPDSSPAMRAAREALIAALMKPAQNLLVEIKDVMNVNNDGSAVGILDKKINALATALATLTAKVEDVMALSAAKRRDPAYAGATLEEFFFAVANPLAQTCGDILEDTRKTHGAIEGSFVGDYTTTVDPAVVAGHVVRVANEAKNRVSVTLNNLVGELDVAMQNRSAASAFGILTNPKAATEPSISIHHGNKVVACLPGFGTAVCDPAIAAVFVRAGYQLARSIAIARTVSKTSETSIDLAMLKTTCEEFNAVVKRFSTLAGAHTRVRTALDNAEETADQIKAALVAAVDKFVAAVDAEILRNDKDQNEN